MPNADQAENLVHLMLVRQNVLFAAVCITFLKSNKQANALQRTMHSRNLTRPPCICESIRRNRKNEETPA